MWRIGLGRDWNCRLFGVRKIYRNKIIGKDRDKDKNREKPITTTPISNPTDNKNNITIIKPTKEISQTPTNPSQQPQQHTHPKITKSV